MDDVALAATASPPFANKVPSDSSADVMVDRDRCRDAFVMGVGRLEPH